MNPAKIILTVTRGSLEGKEYVFKEPNLCTIGRANDCEIQLPGDLLSADVSRHHCMLEIDPPAMRIHDLGSKNGTFVNGKKISGHQPHPLPGDADRDDAGNPEVKDGDELRLGHTVFRVGIVVPEGIREPMYSP
jgi:eukaryotic-like serine/threonine-protein kinase